MNSLIQLNKWQFINRKKTLSVASRILSEIKLISLRLSMDLHFSIVFFFCSHFAFKKYVLYHETGWLREKNWITNDEDTF